MAFTYLKDPLFLISFAAYWANRGLEACELSPPLARWYLNDLFCCPFWIPLMLWANRRLGLRRHDAPPLAHEIVIPLLIWASVFELVLPAMKGWSELAYADPNDVFCYAAGGCFAAWFWNWRYGKAKHDSITSRGRTERAPNA